MPFSNNIEIRKEAEIINPTIKSMHMTLIKLIDQIRMLDNDMIRLQQKVNTVLQMKENEKKGEDEKEEKR